MIPRRLDEREHGRLGDPSPRPPMPDPELELALGRPSAERPPPSPGIAPGPRGDFGRVVPIIVGVFVLLPLLVAAGFWYASEFGRLPFEFAPGLGGTPPWAPFVVLAAVLAVASALPIVFRELRPKETTFYDQIAANKRNSVLLTIALVAALALTAYVIGTIVTLRTNVGLAAAIGAVAAGIGGAIVSYRMGDRVILRMSSARPVGDGEATTFRNVVTELAVAANVPVPRLYLIADSAPNAFTVGRDPEHAVLVATTGLLQRLRRDELQGVVAHEIAHIRNYDSRYNLFVAVLVGTAVLLADGFFRVVTFPFRIPHILMSAARSARGRRVSGGGSGGGWSFPSIGGGGGGRSGGGGGIDFDLGDGDSGGGGLAALLAILIFIAMILLVSWLLSLIAPLVTRLVQLAVSQEREYLADATAVELGRNPEALERALAKVAASDEVLEAANRSTAPLYFVNPIRRFEERASRIWSTHPPTVDRINRLRSLRGVRPATRRELPEMLEDLD